jgi:hypothetical protein
MDKTSKTILAIIAAGLWANAAITIFKPVPASAENETILYQIQSSLTGIANGVCINRKIC